MTVDPVIWIPLVSTIIATIGLKVVERWLGKKDRAVDDAAQIRSELRAQVADLSKHVQDLESEVDEWKIKYYDMRDEMVQRRTELQIALEHVKRLSEETQRRARIATDMVEKHSIPPENS